MHDLDRAHLRHVTLGDPELARDLLELFVVQCDRLGPGLDAADANERATAAHALGGAARAVGATRLAAVAHRIERGETGDAHRVVEAARRAAIGQLADSEPGGAGRFSAD